MSEKEDKLLFTLIKQSQKKDETGFRPPSESIISAYLLGYADESHQEIMHWAMAKSPAFRKTILEMAEAVDNSNPDEIHIKAQEIKNNIIPQREEFLKMHETAAPQESLWERVKSIITWKVYAPVLGTVLIFLLVFTFYQQTSQLNLALKSIEKEMLISLDLRQPGAAISNDKAYGDDQDAALAGFREILKLEDIDFEINPDYENPPPPDSGYTLHLRFMGKDDILLTEINTTFEYVDGKAPEKIKAWILTLPALQLWSIDVKKSEMTIPWKEKYGKEGCITFTYAVDSMFKHGEVFSFQIE